MLHLFKRDLCDGLVCLFQNLRRWHVIDGPLFHSFKRGPLRRPRLSLSMSEAPARARRFFPCTWRRHGDILGAALPWEPLNQLVVFLQVHLDVFILNQRRRHDLLIDAIGDTVLWAEPRRLGDILLRRSRWHIDDLRCVPGCKGQERQRMAHQWSLRRLLLKP